MKKLLYLIIILLTSGIWLSSCRSVQYVPVETVRIEYKTRDSIRYDSIYKHDSIFYMQKGDTVYKYVKQVGYKYLFINRTDSFLKTDTVATVVEVERKLTKWQSMKIELGGWAFGVIIAFVLVLLCRFVYREKK